MDKEGKKSWFESERVTEEYREIFYQIKKATCEKYAELYFGGWDEEKQRRWNNDVFSQSLEQECFEVIKVDDKPVGFFGYTVFDKLIGCVTLQIVDIERREEIFQYYLDRLNKVSRAHQKPIFAKTFLASQDIQLYAKAGFEVVDTNSSHFSLKKEYQPLQRKDYEEVVKREFVNSPETIALMMQQMDNFYDVAGKKVENHSYNIKEDVQLGPNNLMTGFKFDLNYLKLIANEGKICGDYAEIPTRHGVRWAVSTWKFREKTTLADYINKFSGVTIVEDGGYKIIPYGKESKRLVRLRDKKKISKMLCQDSPEQKFLPNDVTPNDNIALIFNMGHEGCERLVKNELQQDFIPEGIRVAPKPNPARDDAIRNIFDKALGDKAAYVMFGIPRNCIEGIFVNRKLEKDKKQLAEIKALFPDCYICNIDGKVIAQAEKKTLEYDVDEQEIEL